MQFVHNCVIQELPKEIYTDEISSYTVKCRNSIWVQLLAIL